MLPGMRGDCIPKVLVLHTLRFRHDSTGIAILASALTMRAKRNVGINLYFARMNGVTQCPVSFI
jgi:hypothetical protein